MIPKLKVPFFLQLTILSTMQIYCLVAGSQDVDNLKVKDFKPVSIYKVPQSKILKAKYPVIDFHSHVSGVVINVFCRSDPKIPVYFLRYGKITGRCRQALWP